MKQEEQEEQEEINKIYDVDKVYFLGTSAHRQSRVYQATEKATNKVMVIRYYNPNDKERSRPQYDQWVESLMLSPHRQLLPFYDRNMLFCIGDPDISQEQLHRLMHRTAVKLSNHHCQGKIHCNIHPRNILVTYDLEVVVFVDSLEKGNLNTFYSSPEHQTGVKQQCIDVYALGVIFLELLHGNYLGTPKDYLTNKPQKIKNPYQNLLFPDTFYFEQMDFERAKRVVKQMLNRNYNERITMEQVANMFGQIVQNKDPQLPPFSSETFSVNFPLLLQQKQMHVQKVKKNSIVKSLTPSLFESHLPKNEISFMKNKFSFKYLIGERQLKIGYGHAGAYSMQVVFGQSEMPQEVRNKMDMQLLVMVLYHTMEEMFDICLDGKMTVKISKNYNNILIGNH